MHHLHHSSPNGSATARTSNSRARDRGQATTEYAIVLLAASLVGVLVIAWATGGGGAAAISRLFNAVVDSVLSNV